MFSMYTRIKEATPLDKKDMRNICLILAIVTVMIMTITDAINKGRYKLLPGPMSRHRDAIAVAISLVAYGQWHGYASYRKVNHELLVHGLSVQEVDLERVGAVNYFEVMTSSDRLQTAMTAAANLDDPTSDGMYFMQDEKGIALLFILAFALFGITTSSLFFAYMLLFSCSILIGCLTFYKRTEVLFMLLAVVCCHFMLVRAISALPMQDINIIYGNRFLGTLGSVPILYLASLLWFRTPANIALMIGASAQVILLCVVNLARTSTLSLVLSLTLLWVLSWLKYVCNHQKQSMPPYSLAHGYTLSRFDRRELFSQPVCA